MLKGNEVEFPKLPGNRAMRTNDPDDMQKYKDGYSNPDLIRVREFDPVEFAASEPGKPVNFEPYEHKPQFELKPRTYNLYISGKNSYRQTTFHNHYEDSTFWERP